MADLEFVAKRLTGSKKALAITAKVIYAKGANVTDDKGIVDFQFCYDAVQVGTPRFAAVGNDRRSVAKRSNLDVAVAASGEAQGLLQASQTDTSRTEKPGANDCPIQSPAIASAGVNERPWRW